MVDGDPASLSALAAELARAAASLRDRTGDLRLVGAHLEEWTGAAAQAARRALAAQTLALEECADAMSASASTLQRFVVDLHHARALATDAERYCREHGLNLAADGSVQMPWGAYSLPDADAFAHSIPQGRRLADRAGEEAGAGVRRLTRHLDDPVRRLQLVAAAGAGGWLGW